MFLSPQVRQVIFFTRAVAPVVAENLLTGLQECNHFNSLIKLKIPATARERADLLLLALLPHSTFII
jgi:hypothetical protein